jgi:hypothetical protein
LLFIMALAIRSLVWILLIGCVLVDARALSKFKHRLEANQAPTLQPFATCNAKCKDSAMQSCGFQCGGETPCMAPTSRQGDIVANHSRFLS